MQKAQRLLEGAGRRATVSSRTGLWKRERSEKKKTKQAAGLEQAEPVQLVPGLFSLRLQDACIV